jgi:AraC-like DNA-binding protein
MSSSAVRTFTDPDAYHAAFRDMQAESVVTGRGAFRAEFTAVRLDRLSLQRGTETLPRTAYSAVDPKLFGIAFPTDPDQRMHVNGRELSQGDIIVFRAGSVGHNRSSTACQWGSLALTHEDIAAAGRAILSRELASPPATHRIKPPPFLLSRLLYLHRAAGHLAQTAPGILARPETARAMDHALVEATVACLASGDPVGERSAYRHRTRVMRRLEETIKASPEEPLYMEELCGALGVSYPTLRACCQEHLGMSPKQYLLLRRMNLARQALRRAHPKQTTVTEIAGSYGFWELGRFSVVYRSLFGESPSATLRRPPEDPRAGEISGSPWQFIKTA